MLSSKRRPIKRSSPGGLEEKAREYAFLLLKFRLRSEQELRSRMKRKKFPAGVIDATVRFLKEKQFLDDGRFSRAWIDSRLKRSIGLRRVKNELRLKGIPSALAEASAAAVTEGYDENEIVQGLISRKTATMKGIDRQKMKQRIYAFLVRRGFSADAIMDNLNKTFRDES